jgi:hypothetical protein
MDMRAAVYCSDMYKSIKILSNWPADSDETRRNKTVIGNIPIYLFPCSKTRPKWFNWNQ